jgi:hypothetical protein
MLTMFQQFETPAATPFRSGEEAWFWTMAAILARRDGAGVAWRPDGPVRPCDPDDVIKCLNSLYEKRGVALLHARILRIWGERQLAPDPALPGQAGDFQLWQQAMGPLEWALRGRGIVS